MFLIINELVLENLQLTSDQKIVLSMLAVFKKSNQYYWGPANYLAGKVGLPVEVVQQIISKFVDMGIITREPQGMMLRIDPATEKIPNLGTPAKRFNQEASENKMKELLDSGYLVMIDNPQMIQLVHPDRSGVVIFNKVSKSNGD